MSTAASQLLSAALSVRHKAYAPYSNFFVGAAILTEDGTVFTGSNVENASYGLSICAERVATGAAVAAGHRRIKAIAIAAKGASSPCGACRQVLAEFGATMQVFLVDTEKPERIVETSLDKLLPAPFDLKL